MQVVLDTKGLKLGKKRQSFLIEAESGESRTLSPNKVSSIAVTENVWLSTEAVRLAVQNEIPILIFDRIGKAQARLWSPYFESIATLRRQQVRFAESPEATQWVIELFALKTRHQLENLDFLKRRIRLGRRDLDKATGQMKKLLKQFAAYRGRPVAEVRHNMMGVEGSISKTYFQALSPCLPRAYRFKKRSRRPAEDVFNAALNYYYGMLYSVVESALFAAGLDPHLGILHTDEYRKPVLAFDLIEIFRPWADRLLIELCLESEILGNFFSKNQYGVFLNKKGKSVLIPRFNAWLRENKRFQEREVDIKSHIYQTAGKLAQRIRDFGEK